MREPARPDPDAPLSIAYLTYRGKPHVGGQGIYTRHLTKALADLGHSVEVFAGQPYTTGGSEEFDVLQPKKNAKGNRKFTPQDIKNLELIYHLVKERGFTLDGAKTHLKENRNKTLNNYEIIRKLERVKAELIKIKDQL